MNIKNRVVTVKGKRGTLRRAFKHLALEITRPSEEKVRVDTWMADRKVSQQQNIPAVPRRRKPMGTMEVKAEGAEEYEMAVQAQAAQKKGIRREREK